MATSIEPPSTAIAPAWLDLVRQKVESLRFGQVHVVVHNHKVTQIEFIEKTRLDLMSTPVARHRPPED
jgi:hypothetical protein